MNPNKPARFYERISADPDTIRAEVNRRVGGGGRRTPNGAGSSLVPSGWSYGGLAVVALLFSVAVGYY